MIANSSPPSRATSVAGAHHALDARGDLLQQPVADGVPERFVDRLEIVEVEIEHREFARAPANLGQTLIEPVLELEAVGQPRQCIAGRHLLDLVLRPASQGDVLVGRNPAAVGELLLPLRYDAAVLELADDQQAAVGLLAGLVQRLSEAVIEAMRERLGAGRAGAGRIERQAVDLGITPVAGDQPVLAIVHRQALHDVVHRIVEALVLDLGLRPYRLAFARGGELFDMNREPDRAERDRKDDHRGAECERLGLMEPVGDDVVHRHRNDRGDRKGLGMGDREHPVDAVDHAGLAHHAVPLLGNQPGEQGALADVGAESDLALRKAGDDGPVVAKDRNRAMLSRRDFLEQFANEDNLTTPLTTPRKAPSLADSRLATLNCHVPVTTLWNGGET